MKRERRPFIPQTRLQAEILKVMKTFPSEDEEFRPPSQARPSIIVPAARRKRLARKPRVASRASDMDLAGDDPASDGGERGESEMSPDSVPVSPGEPDPLPQFKRPTGVADIREDSNVGPDSADPGISTIDNVSFR
ncbi:uncharacterized protein A4U43_C08F17660 [Asparagus officinalis]|nr:uncharacterized protein A4U43_C08F17660 [Asparagus officinalis]